MNNAASDTFRPRLYVLAGPTAVGKGTVAQWIREHRPDVAMSVSATTRSPRPGEVDGFHYHFLSEAEFDARLAAGDFLEWAHVHGAARYGTLRAPVESALTSGAAVLLEIDLAGARQVRESMPEAVLVFLAPPSWEELVRRLRGRGTETAEQQARRLQTARRELAALSEFDLMIVNDSVERAASTLVDLMEGRANAADYPPRAHVVVPAEC